MCDWVYEFRVCLCVWLYIICVGSEYMFAFAIRSYIYNVLLPLLSYVQKKCILPPPTPIIFVLWSIANVQ